MKDMINPKVGFNNEANPPPNLAKTGAPASPTKAYTPIVMAPKRLPKMEPAKMAKKVCSVIGTPPITINGTNEVMFAPIAIRATNIPARVKSIVLNPLFIKCLLVN
jgi:hypothetical protein